MYGLSSVPLLRTLRAATILPSQSSKRPRSASKSADILAHHVWRGLLCLPSSVGGGGTVLQRCSTGARTAFQCLSAANGRAHGRSARPAGYFFVLPTASCLRESAPSMVQLLRVRVVGPRDNDCQRQQRWPGIERSWVCIRLPRLRHWVGLGCRDRSGLHS